MEKLAKKKGKQNELNANMSLVCVSYFYANWIKLRNEKNLIVHYKNKKADNSFFAKNAKEQLLAKK